MCEQLVTSSYPYPNFYILENYKKKDMATGLPLKWQLK